MREAPIFRNPAAIVALGLSLYAGCGSGPTSDAVAVHLVDRFDPQSVKGTASLGAMKPSALWNFSAAEDRAGGSPSDPLLGWKAGPGVTGLKVVDGKLTGRSTTDSALIYATVPDTIDAVDGFHSIEMRIRVDRGETIKANPEGEKLDLKTLDPKGWSITGPLAPGEHFNTAIVKDSNVRTMGAFHTVVINPVNVEGATFEIESIRLISQKEHRDKTPSGVGWQGLSGVFHETIVSRSPESFTIDGELLTNGKLDLSIGTVQSSPVTFKIESMFSEGRFTVFQRTVTTPHRWEDVTVDLSSLHLPYLQFSLVSDQPSTFGFWGSPTIVSAGAKPRAERVAGEALGGVEPPQGVILFVADTLRSDHLDFHGYVRDTTPNLSAMASEGTAFLDTISQAPWTKVSIPSILTSLYPTSHRVFDIPDRISATATTLAEVYRAAGYATVSFPSNNFAGTMTNLHQGFEEMHEAAAFDRDDFRSKTARSVVDHALRWLDGHSDIPFFMYVHVLDPHSPFKSRPPYDTLWADAAKRGQHDKNWEHLAKFIESGFMKRQAVATVEELDKAEIDRESWLQYEKDFYDGSIRGMDAEIGRIRESLGQLGLSRKVLFAFIADHGEEFHEHGKMFHGQTAYGELANVPLVLHLPGTIPENAKITETVRSIDLMPTLLDLSGLEVPENAQGQSLLPLMAAVRGRGGDAAAAKAAEHGWVRRPAVIEKLVGGSSASRNNVSHGLVLDGWKLLHHVEGAGDRPEFELFNHREDPLDLNDVAEQHPDIVENLKAELKTWREMVEQGKLPEGDSVEGLPSEEIERLRTLGYIQ